VIYHVKNGFEKSGAFCERHHSWFLFLNHFFLLFVAFVGAMFLVLILAFAMATAEQQKSKKNFYSEADETVCRLFVGFLFVISWNHHCSCYFVESRRSRLLLDNSVLDSPNNFNGFISLNRTNNSIEKFIRLPKIRATDILVDGQNLLDICNFHEESGKGSENGVSSVENCRITFSGAGVIENSSCLDLFLPFSSHSRGEHSDQVTVLVSTTFAPTIVLF
jgi:hypothetical protein